MITTKSKIVSILTNKRILFISSLVFMILTFALPLNKPGFNCPSGFKGAEDFISKYSEYLIIGMTLIITIVIFMEDKVEKFLDRLINLQWLYISSYLVMITSMMLFITGVPGLWWTWTTIGSFVLMVLLIPIILEGIISKIDALLMGAGVAYFIMAVWEIPYLYGLWKYHEVAQGMPFHNIYLSIEFYYPFIIMGLLIIGLIILKDFEVLRNKYNWKLMTLFLAITIIGYGIWFGVGFPCNPYCDIKTGEWIAIPFNYKIAILVRMTKATANLSFLSLIGFWNLKVIEGKR